MTRSPILLAYCHGYHAAVFCGGLAMAPFLAGLVLDAWLTGFRAATEDLSTLRHEPEVAAYLRGERV